MSQGVTLVEIVYSKYLSSMWKTWTENRSVPAISTHVGWRGRLLLLEEYLSILKELRAGFGRLEGLIKDEGACNCFWRAVYRPQTER